MSPQLIAELCGVKFAPANLDDLVEAVQEAQSGEVQKPLTVGYVNPHVVTTATNDEAISKHLADCDQVLIDGTGVWLALRLWRWGIKRMPAYRAADHLVYNGILKGSTILIGLEPELIPLAGEHVEATCPQIDIAGTFDGYMSNDEMAAALADTPADVILIGAGSPKSEEIANTARLTHPNAIIFHVVGGTLNVYADSRRHAPGVLSFLGIDWLHRYITEPHTRERYQKGIPEFLRAFSNGPNAVRQVAGQSVDPLGDRAEKFSASA